MFSAIQREVDFEILEMIKQSVADAERNIVGELNPSQFGLECQRDIAAHIKSHVDSLEAQKLDAQGFSYIENVEVVKNSAECPRPPFNLNCIYSVGSDGRVHILHHDKNVPDSLSDDILIIEHESSFSNGPTGVYKGSFFWECGGMYDDDGGYFCLSDNAELLYEIPEEYVVY